MEMKTNIGRILIFSIIAYLFFRFSYAQVNEFKPLSLNEAINLSLEKNRQVKMSDYNLKSAKYELNSSYGLFLPKLSIEGKYTKLNSPLQLDLSPLRSTLISADVMTVSAAGATPDTQTSLRNNLEATMPSFSTLIQKDVSYNLTAQVNQPIFTGGRLVADTKIKIEDYKIAENQKRLVQNNVISDVVINYLKVQLFKDVVKIKEEVVEGITEHKRNSEILFRQGVLSKTNKMKTDVALSEAQREYFKATKDKELSEILLHNALGMDKESFDLTTPLLAPKTIEGLSYYIEKGLKNNPDIQNIAHTKNILDQKYRVSISNFMPSISAFGTYELYREDLTPFDPEWSVGLVGSINIFSGASDLNKAKSALKEIDSTMENLEYSKELIKTEITRYYHNIETAREELKSIETSIELARENLKSNKNSFKEGLATTTDVIDAQIALSKTETEKANALFDYDFALICLLNICGDASDIFNFLQQ